MPKKFKMKKYRPIVSLALLSSIIGTAHATETENQGLRLLPAPPNIKIDGKTGDWNLAGGIFASSNVEDLKLRDNYSLWVHGAYDENNLYILARFNDDTPLNNPGDTKLEFAWNGDSLQVRVVTNYGEPNELKSVANSWKGINGADVVELDQTGFTKSSPKGDDIKPLGAQQAFTVFANNKGYNQEIAIPWKLLGKDRYIPKAGDSIVLTIEPNFSFGKNQSRVSVKDIFRPGVPIDRVFTFQNKRLWGIAPLLAPGTAVEPQPVRLADGRTFPVHMEGGIPIIDWTGLVKSDERQGFKDIKFTLPEAGYVSIIIKNSSGETVRHLLNAELRPRGDNVVKWDGLSEWNWKTPGTPVATGEYSWSGIYHKGIGVKLRGFASNAGTVPWDNGKGSNWGGDMAPPSSLATEGNLIMLGWGASEAGRAAVLADLDGKPIWSHKRGGFGGATFVGLDNGIATIVDGNVLYKMRADNNVVEPWTASGAGETSFQELLGDKNAPNNANGMAVRNGTLYFSNSNYEFDKSQITDWRALLTKAAGNPATDALWLKLSPALQKRASEFIASTSSDDAGLRAAGDVSDLRDAVVEILNGLLAAPALGGKSSKLKGSMLAESNRRWIETAYGTAPRNTSFVAAVDAKTGKLQRKIALPGAGALAADAKGVYVIVDGTQVVYVDGQSGAIRTVLKNLVAAQVIAINGAGNLYVGVGAPDNQVHVYSPAGKKLLSIGRPGGRALLGPWQADGLTSISAVAVDNRNRVWVGENTQNPARFSVWDAKTGALLREYFGPTRYGASGGAIYPDDPNVMIGEAVEWKIDPRTGRASAVGVFDSEFHGFARFCNTGNGRDYLAVTVPSFIHGSLSAASGIKIFERLAPGQYKLRSTIYGRQGKPGTNDPNSYTEFWADANDDQKMQPNEIQKYASLLRMGGYYMWSMYLNTDLTFYGRSWNQGDSFQFKVGGYTACGAPIYDVPNAKSLPFGVGLSSLDNKYSLSDGGNYTAYEIASGRRLWSYSDQWMGVHGSHSAPGPEAGLLRGTFGIIGSAKLPEPIGDVWAINSNVGEWHLLTRDGFYLTHLFQSDSMKVHYPDDAQPGADITDASAGLGAEDFGGSLMQGRDGKVYVQAGKTALWNAELTGLDQVVALSGARLTIASDEARKAATLRETLLQEASTPQRLEVRKLTPTFTGNLAVDFKGAQIVSYQKSDDTAVKTALAWDDQNLYAGWEVKDPTPWINNAEAPEYMYARGDTVDLQIGTEAKSDPKRGEAVLGDLRLSIGQVAGKPLAEVFRRISTDKAPMTFSSGVVRDYMMQSVKTLADVKIEVKVDVPGKKYVVEAVIPLVSLGLKPTPDLALRGDLGVTHSDPGGIDTRLRTYWSNQETGLVDDEVYELMMKPSNWGEMIFK